MKKAKIFNVIILDKSGSMSSIRRQAIDGVNETLAAIRSSQLRDPEQDNYVSLVTFCGCELKNIYEAMPIGDVKDITAEQYIPCCMTPLYDAIGVTVTKMQEIVRDEKAAVSVTIITDGYENASQEYTGTSVKALIESCKQAGWLFAYIGADHDVEMVAARLSINNNMKFDKTAVGTSAMFQKGKFARGRWASKMKAIITDENIGASELPASMKESNDGYFDDIPF